ncbi:transcriptional regulator, GntR family [Caloramator quimbayensis]|uniref:Transcriptional regulator, GntR family n=1 Tax=Caloramator quimbayensis TaxID=1147123 RepID=A0A1T4WGY3_9CLOT|nr:GntR family transcriptional regulator [Caloramator quimbayensis]SKA76175.1 transcriptional regulator, GntR family [Caloramator quimbayensis]
MPKDNMEPAYIKLQNDIMDRIKKGEIKIGEKLESEREIAEKYNISRMTVRQAIGNLVNIGVLERRKGIGTFVCSPKITQNNIMSFTEIVNETGLKSKTEVLNFRRCEKDEMSIPELKDECIYEIQRRRKIEDEVVGIETAYIPFKYISSIKIQDLEGSLFNFLKKQGLNIKLSKASIQSLLMSSAHYKLFETERILPLLMVESRYFDENNELIFIENSIYNCQVYKLNINISNDF